MKKTEMASGGLVELVKSKTNLTEIGAYAYGLTLVWALADDKLKNKVIELIEREGNQMMFYNGFNLLIDLMLVSIVYVVAHGIGFRRGLNR